MICENCLQEGHDECDKESVCFGCENWKRRGDELFDELEHVRNEYESLADRLRDRDAENLRLMTLLGKNGIDFQETE